MFINNAWEVTLKSAATWAAQILGYAAIFYAYVNGSSEGIQATLHFDAWKDWLPWVIGLAVAFGIPVARATAQKSVQAAAAK